jgi:drug/metabolite transporter (DMT)-like permease
LNLSCPAQAGAAPNQALGFVLLGVAVCSDAFVPNLQQKLLRGLKMPIGEMVVVSNCGSFALVLAYVSATGELAAATAYLRTRPHVVGLLAAQALAGYAGLRCYLSVIRNVSGVAGVLTTSARKVVTLVLSFLLFEKPFSGQHALALALLAAGVGLTIRAKQRRGR